MSDTHNELHRMKTGGNEKVADSRGGGGSGSASAIRIINTTNDLTDAPVIVKYGTSTISTSNKVGDNVQVGAIGVYTIECGVYSVDVTVTALGTMYYADVNTTDSWKLWLEAGGLDPDDYDDLAEVLADEKAVRRLMTIHDAVDFLANGNKNASLISTIINNDYCAKWINLRDYALDTLYANEDIAELMDTADKYFYGEWVLKDGTWGPKGNVPVMTSNTAPYGEAGASISSSTAWRAFNDSSSPVWGATEKNGSIWYKFTNPICVKRFKIKQANDNTNSFTLLGSNDNANWETISESYVLGTRDETYYDTDNDKSFLYIKLNISYVSGSDNNCALATLQFYGREMKVSVPTMTSNTAPYGVAFASSTYLDGNNTYAPFKAFDNDVSTTWNCSNETYGDENQYVGYDFGKPILAKFVFASTKTSNISDANFKVIASDDKVTWDEVSNTFGAVGDSYSIINAAKAYRYYALKGYVVATSTGVKLGQVASLNFYGFDYSEYDWDTEYPRHYIYDHGVELETISIVNPDTGATLEKLIDNLKMTLTLGGTHLFVSSGINYSNYDLARFVTGNTLSSGISDGTIGDIIVNTSNQLARSNLLLKYSPYHQFLDVSNINQITDCGVGWKYGTTSSNYSVILTIAEWWLE